MGEEEWQACVVLYYSQSGTLGQGVPSFSTGKEKGGKSEGREEEKDWGGSGSAAVMELERDSGF